MPAVCAPLAVAKFEQHESVRLIQQEGPHQGANLRLTFEV